MFAMFGWGIHCVIIVLHAQISGMKGSGTRTSLERPIFVEISMLGVVDQVAHFYVHKLVFVYILFFILYEIIIIYYIINV